MASVATAAAIEKRARKLGFVDANGAKHQRLVHPEAPHLIVSLPNGAKGRARERRYKDSLTALAEAEKLFPPIKREVIPEAFAKEKEQQPPASAPMRDILPPNQLNMVGVQAVMRVNRERPIQEFREAYQHMKGAEVAEYFGINLAQVYYLRDLWNIPPNRPGMGRGRPKNGHKPAVSLGPIPSAAAPTPERINYDLLASEVAKLIDYDKLAEKMILFRSPNIADAVLDQLMLYRAKDRARHAPKPRKNGVKAE